MDLNIMSQFPLIKIQAMKRKVMRPRSVKQIKSDIKELEEWLQRDRFNEYNNLIHNRYATLKQLIFQLDISQVQLLIYQSIARLASQAQQEIKQLLQKIQMEKFLQEEGFEVIDENVQQLIQCIFEWNNRICAHAFNLSALFNTFDQIFLQTAHGVNLQQFIVASMSREIYLPISYELCQIITKLVLNQILCPTQTEGIDGEVEKTEIQNENSYAQQQLKIIIPYFQAISIIRLSHIVKSGKNQYTLQIKPDIPFYQQIKESKMIEQQEKGMVEKHNRLNFCRESFLLQTIEQEQFQQKLSIDSSDDSEDEFTLSKFECNVLHQKSKTKDCKWPIDIYCRREFKQSLKSRCMFILDQIKDHDSLTLIDMIKQLIYKCNQITGQYYPIQIDEIQEILNDFTINEAYNQLINNQKYGIYEAIYNKDYFTIKSILDFGIMYNEEKGINAFKQYYIDFIADQIEKLDNIQILSFTLSSHSRSNSLDTLEQIQKLQKAQNDWLSSVISMHENEVEIIQKCITENELILKNKSKTFCSDFQEELNKSFISSLAASDFFIDYLIEAFHSILIHPNLVKKYNLLEVKELIPHQYKIKVKILTNMFKLLSSQEYFLSKYIHKFVARLIGSEWSNLKKELHILAMFESITPSSFYLKQMHCISEDLSKTEILNLDFQSELEEEEEEEEKIRLKKMKQGEKMKRRSLIKNTQQICIEEKEKEAEENTKQSELVEINNPIDEIQPIIHKIDSEMELEKCQILSDMIKIEENEEQLEGYIPLFDQQDKQERISKSKTEEEKQKWECKIWVTVLCKSNVKIKTDENFNKMRIPSYLLDDFNKFKHYYQHSFKNRLLKLDYYHSYAHLYFIKHKLDLVVSTITMAILLQFNLDNDNIVLSPREIAHNINLSESVVCRKLNILVSKGILAIYDTLNIEEEIDDKDNQLYTINQKFTTTELVMVIDQISLQPDYPPCIEKIIRDQNKEHSQVIAEEEYDAYNVEMQEYKNQIVKANIVKIIKEKYQIPEEDLITEIRNIFQDAQANTLIQISTSTLKENIKDLVESGFLKRLKNDSSIVEFVYQVSK